MPRNRRRLFGRVDRFTVECPRCAEIIRAAFSNVGHSRRMEAARHRPTRGVGDERPRAEATIYNPLTQRLTCPRCRQVFAVGLVLYRVRARTMAEQPHDSRPTWRQLLALRQLSSAVYLEESVHLHRAITGKDSVSILVESTCQCVEGEPDALCPVHGWVDLLTDEDPEVPRGELETLRRECKRLAWENKKLRDGLAPDEIVSQIAEARLMPENVQGDPLVRVREGEPLRDKPNR